MVIEISSPYQLGEPERYSRNSECDDSQITKYLFPWLLEDTHSFMAIAARETEDLEVGDKLYLNREVLRKAIALAFVDPAFPINKKDKHILDRMADILLEDWYSTRLFHLSWAKPITETLKTVFRGKLRDYSNDPLARTPEGLAFTLKNRLLSEPGPMIAIHPSHLNTYETLRAVKEVTQEKIGVVILDAHADFYLTDIELNAMCRDGSHYPPTKANFLRYLIRDNVVEAISVVGMAEEASVSVVQGDDTPYNPTHHVYQAYNPQKFGNGTAKWYQREYGTAIAEHFFGQVEKPVGSPNRIQIIHEGRYLQTDKPASHRVVDLEKFTAVVRKQLKFLAAAGATHLVFSWDADVLRLGQVPYTATEYNPLAYPLYLATHEIFNEDHDQQLDDLLDAFHDESLEPSEAEKLRKRYRRQLHFIASLVSGLIPEFSHSLKTRFGQAVPRSTFRTGLPLSAVGKLFQVARSEAANYGLEFGVPLPNGGRFYGDVVELQGSDIRGNMAKAVKSALTRLE